MKKLLKILLLLFLLSAAALAMYNFVILPYLKERDKPGAEETAKSNDEQKNRVFQISKEAVLGPVISKDKSHLVYYAKDTGNVKQADLDGRNITTISSANIAGLARIEWSPDKDKVFCSRIKGGTQDLYIYSYSEKQVFPLNANMRNIAFSKNGQKIAYSYANISSGESNISIAGADGKNYSAILNTRLNNPEIQWIDSLRIAVWEHPSYSKTSAILIADTASLQLERILSGKNGLSANFSPDGNKALFSYADSTGKNLNLGIYDLKNKKEIKSEIATLAEKCVWSQNNKEAYCAIGQSFPITEMPDKYQASMASSRDYFIKINSETGKYTEVLPKIASLNIDAKKLFLSPTEERLYFVDKGDGKLYGLQL